MPAARVCKWPWCKAAATTSWGRQGLAWPRDGGSQSGGSSGARAGLCRCVRPVRTVAGRGCRTGFGGRAPVDPWVDPCAGCSSVFCVLAAGGGPGVHVAEPWDAVAGASHAAGPACAAVRARRVPHARQTERCTLVHVTTQLSLARTQPRGRPGADSTHSPPRGYRNLRACSRSLCGEPARFASGSLQRGGGGGARRGGGGASLWGGGPNSDRVPRRRNRRRSRAGSSAQSPQSRARQEWPEYLGPPPCARARTLYHDVAGGVRRGGGPHHVVSPAKGAPQRTQYYATPPR
jgi:hypothetical protein